MNCVENFVYHNLFVVKLLQFLSDLCVSEFQASLKTKFYCDQ